MSVSTSFDYLVDKRSDALIAAPFADLELSPAPPPDGNDAIHSQDPPVEGLRVASATAVSPLHLRPRERALTRQKILRSAYLGLHHARQVHYTQNAFARWEGIRNKDRAYRGEYPHNADCSAFATWCIWDGSLAAIRKHRLGDFVNGAYWKAGYTGTQTRHGIEVSLGRLLTADLIFYGGTHSVPEHVAIYVGNGRVISHGSEGGPYLLSMHYRPINHARRYIR